MKKSAYASYFSSAFTLVELIVVISVLSVLATISFSTVGNISSSARDSARLTDLSTIKNALEIYRSTTGVYPKPDNSATITWSGSDAWYHGTLGNNVLRTLGNVSQTKDPLYPNIEYSYSLANNKNEYEVATILENAIAFSSSSQAYAAESTMENKIVGNYNGLLLRIPMPTSNWILTVPTLSISDIKDAKLENVVLALPSTKNLPASYSGKHTATATPFIPTQVYSGSCKDLSNLDFQKITEQLQSAYSTINNYNGSSTVKDLLKITTTSEKIAYAKNIVKNTEACGKITINTTDTSSEPVGFIPVPGNSAFGTSDFKIMKYEAKNVGGIATSVPAGLPWVNLSQSQAIAACQAIGAHLVTNNEWMTLARNIELQTGNWSGGAIGNGRLYAGFNNYQAPEMRLEASADDSNGTYALVWVGSDASTSSRRTLSLSNGQIVWDLAGNAVEHVNKANTLDGSGFDTGKTTIACSTTSGFVDWVNCTDKTWASSFTAYDYTKGIGAVFYAGGGPNANNIMLRGGDLSNRGYTGIFAVNLYQKNDPTITDNRIGFRCAK